MEYELDAIPTKFMGVRFRSRLEAKWAAFFQLMQWKWQYEPRDFSGWMPDFGLYGKTTMYVEVKPISTFHDETWNKMASSGCPESQMLLVGETVPVPGHSDRPYMGWQRVAGQTDLIGHVRLPSHGRAEELWRIACNQVQWQVGGTPDQPTLEKQMSDLSRWAEKHGFKMGVK